MSFGELFRDALYTLWRQKLRSSLTIGGVLVAIAALVALLSFAGGMSKNVRDQVEKFSLLQTMAVSPATSDSTEAPLDSTALAWMTTLPGVLQAYPQAPFPVHVVLGDDTTTSDAQAIPANSRGSLLFSQMKAGEVFAPEDTNHVLITTSLLDRFKIEDADSLIGQKLLVYSEHGHPDSGYAAVRDTFMTSLSGRGITGIAEMLRGGRMDSLSAMMFGQFVSAFFDGYMNRVRVVRDTLIVSGVVDGGEGWTDRLRPVVLPEVSARRLNPGSFTQDPMSLIGSMQSGEAFNPASMLTETDTAERVTLELDATADHETLADTLRAHGYAVQDFAEFYAEFRKMVVLFTAGMSLLGFIAMFIASLGIVNTMVMSILERRREIGVLKALGAEDKDIRILFLVESGTIGLVGSLLGLLVGWVGVEIVGMVMQEYLRRQGVGDVELFYIGPETILIAMGFGVVVATVAGLYPASRAARLDPVVALREE
ncbi:ABC transporter permease [bacterium]|nr:ABC transporter permease [bacterium]